MLPNHPNLLLETALAQLSKTLLDEQQAQFTVFKQQYEQDNQALSELVALLKLAMEKLENSSTIDTNKEPVTKTQLDNLLAQNQQLADQAARLAEQYLSQYHEHQRTIQALTNQVSQLHQSNQALQTQNQQLQQSNQQLTTENQAILAKLSEWITLYQAQDAKITNLMKQLNLLPNDKLPLPNKHDSLS
ncbi:hypothetical protein GCM10010099_23860 [Streptomyces cinereus]|nr:hypothetical protein GCM10010099_23860 [Streptomyces cinereus]